MTGEGGTFPCACSSEKADLRHTQASGVCSHQDGTLLQAGNRFEETCDFIEAEDDRKLHGPPGQGKVLVAPVASERGSLQETQRADGQLHTRWRKLAFVGQVDDPGANLVGAERLR
ncbi:hypothetical protein OKW35_004597 [Paraburkholderia sp. MM5477-R1]